MTTDFHYRLAFLCPLLCSVVVYQMRILASESQCKGSKASSLQHSQPCWPSWTALSQVLYINLTTLILSSYPFTYSSGSYNYNSIKICKQISTPPQPYQKIPDIYFLCSCSLPNFISILSPITIQFVIDVFVLYVFLYFSLYCLTVLFGLTTTKLNKLYYYYYYYYYDLLPGH